MNVFSLENSSNCLSNKKFRTLSSISVVVPAYNEALSISKTYDKLIQVLEGTGVPFEILFVDDGSTDDTFEVLQKISVKDSRAKLVKLSRNFGHQLAVTAGIDNTSGEVIILIDADLQDPPEIIPQFIEKWSEGFEVVYAIRNSREGESLFKKLSAKFFYRILNKLTDIQIPLDTGDFRLMDRKVVNVLLQMPERHRFIRGLVSWAGFPQCGVPYIRSERFAGESKYPLKKMIKFSMDGITSFSFKPLQFALNLGFLCSGLGFLLILVIIILKVFTTLPIQGWTSLMVVILFLGGTQLFIMGIFGEYIGRIYDESRKRPLYIIEDKCNFPNNI